MASTDPTEVDHSADVQLLKQVVRQGHCDKEQAQAIWKRVRAGEGRAGGLLLQEGILQEGDLKRLLGLPDERRSIGGYRLISQLGQGGMGAVYRAKQESMGREVALKLIAQHLAQDKNMAKRFLREAHTAGQVNHPNVVTVYDVGEDKSQLFMALELVTGGDAEQLAETQGGTLAEDQALRIMRDACSGLEAIQAAGLVHRDIKPANIFLTREGQAKLGDLGLARSEAGTDRLTQTGATIGTPAFMSPEQALGETSLDIRSDIYALGATLFTLLTGKHLFEGSNALAVAAKVAREKPPKVTDLNPQVSSSTAELINRCLTKDPSRRYQTPAAMAADIERILQGERLSPSRPVWQQPTVLALVGGIVLVLLSIIVVGLSDDQPTPEPSDEQVLTDQVEPPASVSPEPEPTAEPVASPPLVTDDALLSAALTDAEQLKAQWRSSPYHHIVMDPLLAEARAGALERLTDMDRGLADQLTQDLQALRRAQLSLHPWQPTKAGQDPIQLRVSFEQPGDCRLWQHFITQAGVPDGAQTVWTGDLLCRRQGDVYEIVGPTVDEARLVPSPPPSTAKPDYPVQASWALAELTELEPGTVPAAVLELQEQLSGSLQIRIHERGSSEIIDLPSFPELFLPINPLMARAAPPDALALVMAGINGPAWVELLDKLDGTAGLHDIDAFAGRHGLPSPATAVREIKDVAFIAIMDAPLMPDLHIGIPSTPAIDRYVAALCKDHGKQAPAPLDGVITLQQAKGGNGWGLYLLRAKTHWRFASSANALRRPKAAKGRRPIRDAAPYAGARLAATIDTPNLLKKLSPLLLLAAGGKPDRPALSWAANLALVAQQHCPPARLRLETVEGQDGVRLNGVNLTGLMSLAMVLEALEQSQVGP